MLNGDYDDFIWGNLDKLNTEDARLTDLDDELLDEAVYIWLMTHKSWFDDIYPASFSTGVSEIMTEMLFGKTQVPSRVVSNLFIAMADDSGSDDKDDNWWSSASDRHLDEIVNLGNFADDFRSSVYLYLESSIEDYIFDRMARLLDNEKYERYDEE